MSSIVSGDNPSDEKHGILTTGSLIPANGQIWPKQIGISGQIKSTAYAVKTQVSSVVHSLVPALRPLAKGKFVPA